jgi:hypothetical protein
MSVAKILFRSVIVNMISAVSMYNYQVQNRGAQFKVCPCSMSFTAKNPINNIVMKKAYMRHYDFFEGSSKIGSIVIDDAPKDFARLESVPQDWFIVGGNPNERGLYPVKPNVFLSDFVIEDRIGLTGDYQKRKSGKKYGVMCFQKILEWAQENGFGHRISLCPGKTHSDINPAPFYAKIGFDVAPEIEKILSVKPDAPKINGRYLSRGQEVFLVEPEVLKAYPLE